MNKKSDGKSPNRKVKSPSKQKPISVITGYFKIFLKVFLIVCLASSAHYFNLHTTIVDVFQNYYFSAPSSSPDSIKSDTMASSGDSDSWKTAKTIYEFKAKDIHGTEVDMNKYNGNVILIVNVACMCGFTAGNYPEMQELHKKYSAQGLSVLAFPCNQFGGQEPKPENEILEFVKQYNVEFDMFSKVNVNGEDAHPMYKYLKSKQGGTLGDFIKWNFSKFLINRQGVPVKRYAPTTKPLDIEKDIVNLLNEKAQL